MGVSLVALFLCGTALRPQLVGISPLFPDLERSLGISHAVTGLMTALPLVCMGAFALTGVPLTRLVGSRTAVSLSLLLLAVAGALRAAVGGAVALVLLTVAIGIGIAVAGAVVPHIVKENFVGHPVRATASYASGIQVGSTISAAVAIPLAMAFGGWQGSLATFAAFTFVVLAVWLVLAPRAGVAVPVPAVAVGKLAGIGILASTFALFGAGYYGLITWLPEIYVRQGWSPFAAGALLGVLNIGAMVGGFAVAFLAGARRPSYRVLLALSALFAAGITGFVLLPQGSFLWAIVSGIANGALLPLVLALPLELSSDPVAVARASAIMLGLGYTIAAAVPVVLGGVRDLTGSFAASEVLLAVTGWTLVVAVTMMFRTARQRL
jgi:MFS transporter, CP family, cyanate transporter